MPVLSPTAIVALRAAHAAGEVHRRFFRRIEHVEYKHPNDPVTEADRAAEAAVVEILQGARPGDAILGEEGGRRGQGARTWLVDPLDGTTNYSRGIPWFCVSIALEDEQTGIALGVILNPIIGEVYAAERGLGAYAASVTDLPADPGGWGDLARWRRLSVSTVSSMPDAGFATGFPHNVGESRVNIDHFVNIRLETSAVRAMGSAALGLAYVAAGHLEGFWEIGPKAWDFAAGMALVQEAGGRVSDLRGRPLPGPGAGVVLATNGVIHDAAVAVFVRGRSGLE